MFFISPQMLFSFRRYLSFCLDFLVMYRKGLIKKIKVNFKFYDVTAWLTNNCNIHIAQYFEMSDLLFHVCLQYFPFRAFVTMIYWTSTEVLLNLVAPPVAFASYCSIHMCNCVSKNFLEQPYSRNSYSK